MQQTTTKIYKTMSKDINYARPKHGEARPNSKTRIKSNIVHSPMMQKNEPTLTRYHLKKFNYWNTLNQENEHHLLEARKEDPHPNGAKQIDKTINT